MPVNEIIELSDNGPQEKVKIKTLGIPVLNRGDLLMRCVQSVDYPVETLFIINNGTDRGVCGFVEQIQRRDIPNASLFGEIHVEQYKNLGCARSWNHVMRTCPGAWLMSGNDIQFTPGDIKKIADVLEANQDASIVCAMGYAVYCMTEIGVKKVGLFDENFYPAYFEDNDHFRRVRLTGAKAVGVPDFKAIHGEAPLWGSATVNSDPEIQKKNSITFTNLRNYYIQKWGGEPDKEKFNTPYNKDVPLDFCEYDAELRKKNLLF